METSVAEQVYRTPDSAFAGLNDFPFSPHYVTIHDEGLGGLRVHYVDEGARGAPIVLCLHGEPTWCYLYRKMIKLLVDGGVRVIAPDLIGFGRSDKPTRRSDYSYNRMVDWLVKTVDALQIEAATLFVQDWGGLIGLRVLSHRPELFRSVVASNTAFPLGHPPSFAKGSSAPFAFRVWRAFSRYSPIFPIGAIVDRGCQSALSAEERTAYTAPFPTKQSMTAARCLPSLVPSSESDPGGIENQKAWNDVLTKWEKPFLTLYGTDDPITRGWEKEFQKHIPGAVGEPHAYLGETGHFSQEDAPEELSNAILRQVERLERR